MQPKARMTFRFEPPKPIQPMKPKEQPIKKASPLITDEQTATKELFDQEESFIEHSFTTWDSPYQDDIRALEEIIRRSDAVTEPKLLIPLLPSIDHSSENVDESINALNPAVMTPSDEIVEENWTRPSIDMIVVEDLEEDDQIDSGSTSQSHRASLSPSWGRVFLSVTAAIATGALFGYLVLSLFTGESLFPGRTDNNALVPVTASPGQEAAASPTESSVSISANKMDPSSAGGKAESTQIPANDFYMLQFGVFQSEESMQAAVQQLHNIGLDSTVEMQDGYRVFVGAAGSRDEAELLATQLTDIELYIRPMDGSAYTITSEALPKGGADFMNASSELIRLLALYSGSYLQDSLPQVMTETELSTLKAAQTDWQSRVAVADTFNEETLGDIKRMVQAIHSAVLSITEYNNKPSRFHLWSIQNDVMKAILADRKIRSLL